MPPEVKVVPYDPKWTAYFDEEKQRLKRVLGANCLAIHHIGSTSVPGLSAKPIIDMIPVVKQIAEVKEAISSMEELGYTYKGEFGVPFRRFFKKFEGNTVTHHAHIYEIGNPEIERHLLFRDWMRSHTADAKAYENLKKDLAKQFPRDIIGYCHGKEAFISAIENKIDFNGMHMVRAFTTKEKEAVRKFSQAPLPSFGDQNHVHLILYMGPKITGYIHLHLPTKELRTLKVESETDKKPFTELCTQWLEQLETVYQE